MASYARFEPKRATEGSEMRARLHETGNRGYRRIRPRNCPHCKCNRREQCTGKGPRFAGLRCGQNIHRNGQAITFYEAMDFVMPFGPYAGTEMGKIAIDYL